MISSELEAEYGIIDRRFRPIRRLGSGASGEVILVQDLSLDGTLLALKILYPHLLLADGAYARFRMETRVTMQLSHPNILPTYGMGKSDEGLVYIKMAFNDGIPLDVRIVEYELGCEIDFTIFVLRSVAAGLRNAHLQGVIHRDLKPGNILLSKDGSVRIADFGMAYMIRSEAKHTRQGSIVGTPHYIAPETLRGELPDARSDIYALGVVAFELLTGRVPYDAGTFWDLADVIQNSEIPDLKVFRQDVPDWLVEFVSTCLAKDKRARYADTNQVLKALGIVEFDTYEATSKNLSIIASPEISTSTFSPRNIVYRAQQYAFRVLSILLILGICIAIPFLPPRLNRSAQKRYARGVFFIEKILEGEAPFLRSLFNIPVDIHWPEVVFNKDLVGVFTHEYLSAGYRTDVYYEPARAYPVHGVVRACGFSSLIRMFDEKADLNLQNDNGQTALLMAIEAGCETAADELMTQNVDPNIQDKNGVTPLHVAARRANVDTVRRLLSLKGNPNLQDTNGNTPLHNAYLSGNAETVQALLKVGADPSILNLQFKEPLDYMDEKLAKELSIK